MGGVEKRGLEAVWRGENRVKTTCIMTPMPNHLSTCLSLSLNHKTTQNSVGIRKRGSVGMEQMRRMDEMAWLSGLVG